MHILGKNFYLCFFSLPELFLVRYYAVKIRRGDRLDDRCGKITRENGTDPRHILMALDKLGWEYHDYPLYLMTNELDQHFFDPLRNHVKFLISFLAIWSD